MLETDQVNAIVPEVFAPWIQDLKPEAVSIGEDVIRFEMPANDRLVRIGGIVCGQALVSFADTAMVLALSARLDGFKPVTTVDLVTSFMKPVRNNGVWCDVEILRLGRQMAFLRAVLGDTGGTPATAVNGTYMLPPPDKA